MTETSSGQITFAQEVARKATHMGALIIPGGYYLLALTRGEMLTIMITATVLMIIIDIARLRHWVFYDRFASKVIGPMVRGHESAGDFLGATYILLSVCLTIALYDKYIAIAALGFIIVGDSFAALVGRKIGRHKFGHKSVEGTLACLVGTLLVAMVAPQLPLLPGIIGAVVATTTEALSTKIDDNISVPIISGLVMTIAHKIFIVS